MEIDVTQSLKNAENALRDFIAMVLSKAYGANWFEKCGVSAERLSKWSERKDEEVKRQGGGTVEERLIYYADFYDIPTILKKHWSAHFSAVFGEWKVMEVWLTELQRVRDPDAHRRELLPHQKHLIAGIEGELRTRMIRFRSKQDAVEDYFPRFESVRDSVGNIWTPEARMNEVFTKTLLRPGDVIDFVATATDPLGESLRYRCIRSHRLTIDWAKENSFSVRISEMDIGKHFSVSIEVASHRKYHAGPEYDDAVSFVYTVLPPAV